MALRFSRPIVSGLFAAGFLAAVICCAVATVLALYGPAGPADPTLFWVLLAAGALTLALVAMAGGRLANVLLRQLGGGPTPRLHLRFVALFSFAAITPAVLMAVFFGVLLTRGLETWFGEQVEASVESAEATAQFYLDQIVEQAELDAALTAADLSQDDVRAVVEENPAAVEDYLADQAVVRAFTAAYVVDGGGAPLVGYESQYAPPYSPPTDAELAAARFRVAVDVDREARALRLLTRLENYEEAYLYAVQDVNPALFDQFRATAEAIGVFRDARDQRRRIEGFFALIYIQAALLILAGSMWLALSAAGRVVQPIGRLVEAADRVRRGDLAVRVEVGEEDRDEIAALGRAFNLMTGQLERQRRDLIDANAQSEDRRMLIEAVLLGVSAGVLSVDERGGIRLANRSAGELLGLPEAVLRDRSLAEIAPALAEIAAHARARPGETVEAEIALERADTALMLNVRAAMDAVEGRVVLTFDDITRLIAAQRNAAWRDVARRIAHEIKNPLTPIQLSAERLQRRYRPQDDKAADVFDRCTDTIIRQVSDIGRMVDEFSAFARMPTPRIEPASMQELAQETVFARRVASPGVKITLEVPDAPVIVQCDARLASQALANILKNAAESIAERVERGGEDARWPGRIDVRVSVRPPFGVVEIEDNGLGWPPGARERLTEPYMTTREKGTGLGLAIVQRIMEDHGGRLELDAPKSASGEGGPAALVRLAFPLSADAQAAEAAE